jgi:predicted acylesterase/phospholipase RssA
MYLLIRGRLVASLPDEGGGRRVIGEVAVGEAVGEMALIGGGPRNADIDAIRDSRLLRIGVEPFRRLTARHPEFLWNLARLVVKRSSHAPDATRGVPRVQTIAVTGIGSPDVRRGFVADLARHLEPHGATALLDAAALRAPACDDDDPRRMAEFLREQETRHRFLLLPVADDSTEWAKLVLRQADRVLLVAPAAEDPERSGFERWMDEDSATGVRPRRDLVLLHEGEPPFPRNTAAWLDALPSIRHYHVRVGHDDDVARLARFLAGRAVGLVFAGGGAKGFAHLGVLQALREEGVPVDLVGGTSIGAILAAAVATGWSQERLVAAVRASFVATNPANDYRVPPIVSLVKGRKVERLLRQQLGDGGIEDLWLPFFCVTSNLTASAKAIHTRGPLWKLLRASASIPGVFPPVVLDRRLHVDGGAFDNLPVGVARDLDAGHVIACDIQRLIDGKVRFDDVPSTPALLLDCIPGLGRYRVPGMISTMMQATFLAGLENARRQANDADLFFAPRTRGLRFLEWSAVDRASDQGYAYARERIEEPEIRSRLEQIKTPGG